MLTRHQRRGEGRERLYGAAAMLLALVGAGCGASRTDLMDYAAAPGFQIEAPAPGKATVVFMRTTRGEPVASVLFDGNELLGVLMDRTYFVDETAPGKHRFMVLSEAADFMDADLEAGKVYFAQILPRMGMWRARFSLRPVTPNDPDWKDMGEWIATSNRITLNAAGRSWAQENEPSINQKRAAYLERWLAKPAGERPTLYPQEGVPIEEVR